VYYSDGQTSAALGSWGERIAQVTNSGNDDVTTYQDFDDLYSSWGRRRFIDSEEMKKWRADPWGRKFRLEVFFPPRANEAVVRIISAGSNGVYERGSGDDLYVEVRIDRAAKRAVAIGLHTISANGVPRDLRIPVPEVSGDP
jgi:hypothetical protein